MHVYIVHLHILCVCNCGYHFPYCLQGMASQKVLLYGVLVDVSTHNIDKLYLSTQHSHTHIFSHINTHARCTWTCTHTECTHTRCTRTHACTHTHTTHTECTHTRCIRTHASTHARTHTHNTHRVYIVCVGVGGCVRVRVCVWIRFGQCSTCSVSLLVNGTHTHTHTLIVIILST